MRVISKRFEDLLEALNYEDLVMLKKDIDSQALSTKRIVEEKLKKKMREFEKTCSVCQNDLRFYSTSNYTLIFGPDDLQKKASFCGIDCLEYFIGHLRQIKSGRRPESKNDSQQSLMDEE